MNTDYNNEINEASGISEIKDLSEENVVKENNNDVIEKADNILGNKKKKLLPLVLLILLNATIQVVVLQFLDDKEGYLSSVITAVWGFIVYPATCLGVANYSLKMIKGEEARVKDIFKFYNVKFKDAICLGLLMSVFASLSLIVDSLVYFNIINDSLTIYIITIIVLMFISVRLVLVPFIFVEDVETGALSIIRRAWKLSKGRSIEIISIFFKVFLAATLFVIVLMIVGFAMSFALPIMLLATSVIVLFLMGFVSIYQNLVFAEFALKVFAEEGIQLKEN